VRGRGHGYLLDNGDAYASEPKLKFATIILTTHCSP
jgi:hypothetical protein